MFEIWLSRPLRIFTMCALFFSKYAFFLVNPEKRPLFLYEDTQLPHTRARYFMSNGGNCYEVWLRTFLIIIKNKPGWCQLWDCGLPEVFRKHPPWMSRVSFGHSMPLIVTSVGKDQISWDFIYLLIFWMMQMCIKHSLRNTNQEGPSKLPSGFQRLEYTILSLSLSENGYIPWALFFIFCEPAF